MAVLQQVACHWPREKSDILGASSPLVPPSLSVVIPALDEESRIADAIRSVRADAEVIVVDGGSRDATRAVAAGEGARVLESPAGRGPQLDRGARAAGGDWIVFLHADTRLEAGWAEALRTLPPEIVGGAFRLAIDSPRSAFRAIEAGVRLRVRLFALPYGDQALFARREAYARVGGIPPLPLMEDVAFVARLRCAGPLAFPSVRALTSARRWERHGVVGTTLRNWRIMAWYLAGRAPEKLARMYGDGGEGASPAP
jgi:rSAM/selenodomain-associated transferase 2